MCARSQSLHLQRWGILWPLENIIGREPTFAQFYLDGDREITLEKSVKIQFAAILRWFESNQALFPLEYQALLHTMQQEQAIEQERNSMIDVILPILFDLYIDRFKKDDYFLSTHELDMFAILYNIDYILLTANNFNVSLQALGERRVIYHEGLHFERCEIEE